MSPTVECKGLCYSCREFFGFSVTTPKNMVETGDLYDALSHPEREEGPKPFISNGREVLNQCSEAPTHPKEYGHSLGDIQVIKITR